MPGRTYKPRSLTAGAYVQSDTSEKYISPVVELRAQPKINFKDIDALKERIDYFFDFCIQRNLRPGVALLATAIGVTEVTLRNWEMQGGERGELIAMAKENINTIMEQLALNNQINPTTLIWFQKNHFGYQDNVTIETRHTTSLDALPSKEDIMKRLPVDDDDDKFIEGDFREVLDEGEESVDIDGD